MSMSNHLAKTFVDHPSATSAILHDNPQICSPKGICT